MTVLFHGNVREYTSDAESLEVGGARSVRELIALLGERYGAEFGAFLLGDDTCMYLVNGSGILTTGGLDTPLTSGDTVEILPFVDGG